MKIAKKVEVQYGFCACAVVASTDSVFPSTVAHWGTIVKGPLRRSVGGESGTIGALHWLPSRHLPDREASLIKKEYCRCGPHPPQATSPRARPPLVKGAGLIGPPFPEFRGRPLRLMASIALWGLQTPAPEVVPGASLHSEAPSPECGRERPGTGDCEPTRHVGAGLGGLLLADCSQVARAMTPGPPPQPHGWVRLGLEVSRFPDFCEGGWHVPTYLGAWSLGLFSPTFFSTSSKKNKKKLVAQWHRIDN